MRELRVSRAAQADLLEIWVYVAEQRSLTAATRLRERIEAQMEILCSAPFQGRSRPEWGEGMRSVLEGNIVIAYRVTDALVEIVRVVHGARNLDELFKEGEEE